MPSRRRPSRQSPELADAVSERDLKAARLALHIELCAAFAVLLPKRTKLRVDIISALDQARELLRDLHPNSMDEATTRILPTPAQIPN